MVLYLFFRKWSYFTLKVSLPYHFCPIALVARSPTIYLLPFPFLGKNLCQNTKNNKNPKKYFWPFFPPSVVSLFHPRLPTMKKILSAFISISYSLNLSVNEIEFPFTNSILIKKWNASSDLASFHACKRIWKGILAVQIYDFFGA